MSLMCKTFLPVYNSTNLKKSIKIFKSYDHKCTATSFMVHSVHKKLVVGKVIMLASSEFDLSSSSSRVLNALYFFLSVKRLFLLALVRATIRLAKLN